MFALQRIVALKEALKGGTLIECTGPNGGAAEVSDLFRWDIF